MFPSISIFSKNKPETGEVGPPGGGSGHPGLVLDVAAPHGSIPGGGSGQAGLVLDGGGPQGSTAGGGAGSLEPSITREMSEDLSRCQQQTIRQNQTVRVCQGCHQESTSPKKARQHATDCVASKVLFGEDEQGGG